LVASRSCCADDLAGVATDDGRDTGRTVCCCGFILTDSFSVYSGHGLPSFQWLGPNCSETRKVPELVALATAVRVKPLTLSRVAPPRLTVVNSRLIGTPGKRANRACGLEFPIMRRVQVPGAPAETFFVDVRHFHF
jgi:hypothetical protein